MTTTILDLGSPGNCIPCSKPRDRVVGDACLDCRVYYGTATAGQIAAVEYAREEYQRGYQAGLITAVRNLFEQGDKNP